MADFFQTNREIVFFIYGQTFFVLGLAVALQSRHRSQIALAKYLGFLAAFGILHGIYDWGVLFIPTQQTYLTRDVVNLLWLVQLGLEAASFFVLFQFGMVLITTDWRLRLLPTILGLGWLVTLVAWQMVAKVEFTEFRYVADAWVRYLLGTPGAAVAA